MASVPLKVRKGAWSGEEDILLRNCLEKYGEGKWYLVPHRAGLNRCRKSCRLRWMNYLRPDIKRGNFSHDEVDLMIKLHKLLGNRWSLIAGRLPGRTANGVKNYWNTYLCKKAFTTNEKSKGCTPKISRSTIIKPQPLNLSKTTLTNLNATRTNENLGTPFTSAFPLAVGGAWWEDVLVDCDDFAKEKISEKDVWKRLRSGEISPRVVEDEDDHLQENQPSDMSNIYHSTDIDHIWDLLNVHQ